MSYDAQMYKMLVRGRLGLSLLATTLLLVASASSWATTYEFQFGGAWFGPNSYADAEAACGGGCKGFNSATYSNSTYGCRALDPWGRYTNQDGNNVTGFYRTEQAGGAGSGSGIATTHCYIYNSPAATCPAGYDGPGYCEDVATVNLAKTRGADQCEGSSPSTFAGNPIDFGAKRKVEREVDYVGSGPFALTFSRTYNGDLSFSENQAWSHSYSERLILGGGVPGAPAVITFVADNGSLILFNDDASGNWVTWGDLHMSLSFDAPTSRWILVDSERKTRVFDGAGRLISIEDRLGRSHSVTYTSTGSGHDCGATGELMTVTHFTGRSFDLCKSAEGLLVYLDDPDPDVNTKYIKYSYANAPHSTKTLSLQVLDSVVYRNGDKREYVYDGFYRLVGIADWVDGVKTTYASWGYLSNSLDGFNTPTSSQHAGVDRVSIAYGPADLDGDGVVDISSDQVRTTHYVSANEYLETDVTYDVIKGVSRPVQEERLATPSGSIEARASTTAYDALGNLVRRVDHAGHTSCYSYSSDGLLELTAEGVGTSDATATRMTWNVAKRLPTKIESGGTYSGNIDCSNIDPSTDFSSPLITEVRTYGSDYLLDSRTLTGDASVYSLNQATGSYDVDQSSSIVAAGSRTWTYTYKSYAGTSYGQIETVDGPLPGTSDLWTYGYDSVTKELSTITNPEGHVITILARDAHGNPTEVEDANGIETHYVYDNRNRLTTVTVKSSTGDAVTTYTYTDNDLLEQIEFPAGTVAGSYSYGAVLNFEYDDAHRLVKTWNASGDFEELELDEAGNVEIRRFCDGGCPDPSVEATDPGLKGKLLAAYDELSRLKSLTVAGNDTTYAYDTNDLSLNEPHQEEVTDALSRNTAIVYDALMRVETVTGPSTAPTDVTSYSYDRLSRPRFVVDPKGVTTHYVYNGFGELRLEESPDAGLTLYNAYDPAGNLTKVTDPRGTWIETDYDALNRATAVRYFNASGALERRDEFYWDARSDGVACSNGVGRLCERIERAQEADPNAREVYRFDYDDRGNLLTETREYYGAPFTTAYTYDLADNVASIAYPYGHVLRYTRDLDGRVTDIDLDTGTGLVPIVDGATYYPFGPMAQWTLGNGTVNRTLLDRDYRVEKVVHDVDANDTNNNDIENWTIGYDNVSRISSITDGAAPVSTSQTFAYKSGFDYLETALSTMYGDVSYDYDANGNRTCFVAASSPSSCPSPRDWGYADFESPTGVFRETNKLDAIASSVITFDAAGNQEVHASSTLESWAYDAMGRNSLYARDLNVLGVYVYDSKGQRTVKAQFDTSGNVLQGSKFDYDQDGRLISELIFYPSGEYELVVWVWLNDIPVVQKRVRYDSSDAVLLDRTTWLHTDHLGTPRIGTNDSKAVVWKWESDPFGIGAPDENPNVVNLRFPGQYYDEESGDHYNYFRDYDPSTGRYLQSDPIGLDGGLNTYLYANANPIRYVDPTGESALGGVLTGLGADLATPEPTDAAWPKWVGWGASIAGAAIYDMCTESDEEREKRCEENLERDLETCRALGKRGGKAAYRVREQQARLRYSNCLSGRDDGIDAPLPPWGDTY